MLRIAARFRPTRAASTHVPTSWRWQSSSSSGDRPTFQRRSNKESSIRQRQSSLRATLSRGRTADREWSADNEPDRQAPVMDDDEYFAPELLLAGQEKYYWVEEEYDSLATDWDGEEPYKRDAKGRIIWEMEDEDKTKDNEKQAADAGDDSEEDEDFLDDEEEGEEDETAGGRYQKSKEKFDEHFYFNQYNIFNLGDAEPAHKPDESVLPLGQQDPGFIGLMEAMVNHPTQFAKVTFDNVHPTSQREPKPIFPPFRQQPSLEFVEAHARFLYITGLPPLVVNGEAGDLENPLHRHALQQTVANLYGLDSTRVYAANTTSAYVGFASPKELADALKKGPSPSFFASTPVVGRPEGDPAMSDFVKYAPAGTVVQISNLPVGHTSPSLARDLFPADTEVGRVYGKDLTAESFLFLKRDSVLLRFPTPEAAEAALQSELMAERLAEFGRHPVRVFRARRELRHSGFGGPTKRQELRVLGPRLIVDGDMPTKDFYLSHADVLQITGLDPQASKADISCLFDRFATLHRDVGSSVEVVTCQSGLPTGTAYVGFDLPGEVQAAIEAYPGRTTVGDRAVTMRLVRPRAVPHRPTVVMEKRPDRSEAELLTDLNDWERHCDPADVTALEQAGVPKVIVSEALRALRFANPTFGPLDASLRSEALRGSDYGRGGEYAELVQLYVRTLVECLATPDQVGNMYELLHSEGEPIDLEIFDREVERQKGLAVKRENP